MSIDIERVDDDRRDEWDSAVAQSPQATVFHQYAALQRLATDSGTTLHPLLGFKGQEPVGVFPVFELTKGPLTGVFSPPPNLWVPQLGPALLNMAKLKQRKRERRRKRFIDGVFERLETEFDPSYVRVRTPQGFTDARPFKWNDCTVTPEYTYVTDLTDGEDALLDRFSSDARRNITSEHDVPYTITEEGPAATVEILNRVRARYREQDEPFPVPESLPKSLYHMLPAGQLRPYVLRVEGTFVGGILAYDYDGTVARWHGGVTPDTDVDLPINDLLDWRLITDAISRDRTAYDLVGAGNPRLNRYKAKFAPSLERFYTVERSAPGVDTLLWAYRRFAPQS